MLHRNFTRRPAGFSLVELLLALALGLVVVTGIVQLFVGNSQTYQVLNGQARMQENGRFALEFISRAARSAGYFGCSLDRSNYVNGLGGEWENIPDREFDINQAILAEPDSITFRSMRQPARRLTDVAQPDEPPTVRAPGGDPGFEAGDVVVLANCEQRAVFRVTGVNDLGGNEVEVLHQPGGVCDTLGSTYTSAGNAVCVVGLDGFVQYTLSKLNRSYGADAVIGAFENVRFFIAAGADGNDALFQEVSGTAPTEIVSGVEALTLWYGLDTDPGDGERRAGQYVEYANLPDPTDLSDVVAVRVRVTVNSGDAVDGDGNLLRRSVGKTILLRNSSPQA